MVDFVLGRIRFKFKGNWATSTAYLRDDVITYGGRSYVCLSNHTSDSSASGGFYTDSANWELMTDGVSFKGNWAGSTYYKINDIVKWGADIYICNTGHTSNNTWTVTESNFTLLVGGLEFEDSYNGATLYQPGDIVRYGGYQFVATNETTGNLPTDTNYWDVLSTGFTVQDDYNAGTAYKPGDVVRYGGYTYVAKADTTGNAPNNNTYWTLVVRGVKHNGNYNAANTYQLGDTVSWNGSSWIATTNNVSGVTPQPSANAYWSIYAQGTANVLTTRGDTLYQETNGYERLPIGANGQVLAVYAGIPRWEDNAYANNVFYVAPNGTDDASFGKTLQRPFKTIKYATGHVANTAGAGTRTTIFVKDGIYSEQLPITVPANTAIMGDSQRTVVVTPAGGNDDTGTKLNSQSTMWYVSDGVLLKQMTFTGMTGFAAGSPDDDITAATVGGVFVRFNPASPIYTKSPYILECSAISNGGIGVIVDGSIHGTGYKSMVFHAYTNLNNDGVGYWVKDNGRAEIVSCFSYYCWFGIATSGGGFVRGLNNNNSYGRYGAVSRGYDTTESVLTGKIYGQQLAFSAGSTMAFNVGEFITGGTSSANGLITNVQAAANKLYYWPISGTFQNSEVVTGVSTAVTATITSSGVTGQKGYVLITNGFTSEPKPGRSIQIAGDSDAYVIQSVSGTYTSSNSQMVLVLAQEKANPSANAETVTIRQNFSQIRLTGHDFLDIGTGNTATANIPGVPSLPVTQANEVVEYKPGRVYYVSTDQNGNFRVGEYFKIDQATGRATLDASAFDLSGLTSLKLGSIGAQLGETINEFSSDVTLGGDSNQAVPTEHAVKYYTDNKFVQLTAASQTITGNVIVSGNLTIVGGATQISANNLVVGDSLIYLAANNYSGTDTLDIGFIGNYGNATSANVHTGLIRDASNKQYYLFQGYDAEPANNTFVPGGNNMTNAVLVADLNTSNLTLNGANAYVWVKSAYDTTNAAYNSANSGVDLALTPTYNSANLTLDANGFVTFYQDSIVKISNTTYTIAANSYALTSWKETHIPTNTIYTYTASYAANGMINTITRV